MNIISGVSVEERGLLSKDNYKLTCGKVKPSNNSTQVFKKNCIVLLQDVWECV